MSGRGAVLGSAAFFVAGPGVVAGLVPWLLTGWRTPGSVTVPVRALGIALVAAGAVMLVASFSRFAGEGRGTPLPAAAPDRLVVGGIYRHVRNPMYVALVWIILGQAALLGQAVLVGCAGAVLAVTAAFVRWYEEPELARRFGAQFAAYRQAVPGWWPRLRPWMGGGREAPGGGERHP